MKTKDLFCVCLIVVCCWLQSCDPTGSSYSKSDRIQDGVLLPDDSRSDNYFPFDLMSIDGHQSVVVSVNDTSLATYIRFFNKYGYKGNGFSWEGHIRQILAELDPTLLSNIEFDSEENGFYAYMQNKEDQLKFATLLSPIFSDPEKLGACLEKADRSKIDD